jgi:hypothetical protein
MTLPVLSRMSRVTRKEKVNKGTYFACSQTFWFNFTAFTNHVHLQFIFSRLSRSPSPLFVLQTTIISIYLVRACVFWEIIYFQVTRDGVLSVPIYLLAVDRKVSPQNTCRKQTLRFLETILWLRVSHLGLSLSGWTTVGLAGRKNMGTRPRIFHQPSRCTAHIRYCPRFTLAGPDPTPVVLFPQVAIYATCIVQNGDRGW